MFDTEDLLKATESLIKSKLNDELVVIDNQKGDYSLDPINDNAWYFQNLHDQCWSYPIFVVWGMYDNPNNTDNQNNNSLKNVEMFFEVCVPDSAGPISQNTFYKLLRYTRALERVIHKNYDKIRSGLKVQVDSLNPSSFLLDEDRAFRSAGILVKAAISAN